MTLNQLASKLAKLEGKRSQARIHDIRELLGILADLVHEDIEGTGPLHVIPALVDAGLKRAKRRPKGKARSK